MVLDGSMALGFLLDDEQFSGAWQVRRHIEAGHQTYVPGLWWYEITNGLLMAERRRRIKPEDVAEAMVVFSRLAIITDEQPLDTLAASILSLAREFKLTFYDASYLELALRRNSCLATADDALLAAAEKAGLKILGGGG